MIQATQFELDVLKKLVFGNSASLVCLAKQLEKAKITERKFTGHGFYLNFKVDDDVPALIDKPTFPFGDVSAEVEGLQCGGGFLLWIKDGLIDFLEGYSYQETWPEEPFQYRLYYDSGKDERDLNNPHLI